MSRYRRHLKNRDRGYRNACGEAERPRRRGPKLRGRCRGPFAALSSGVAAAAPRGPYVPSLSRRRGPNLCSRGALRSSTATPTSAAAVAIRFETI